MELEGIDIEKPYPEVTNQDGEGGRLRTVIGADSPELQRLRVAVLSDRDTENFGIGWWKDYLDVRRRILISDYLLQCLEAVHENFLEARLHLLQLPYFRRTLNKFVAGIVSVTKAGSIKPKFPRSTKPADDLPSAMIKLHTAGVVRATASALDCLGGILVGVIGLEEDILRTDFRRATRALEKPSQESEGANALLHKLHSDIREAEIAAGPTGWLSWVTDYRNMLVHRGRRLVKTLLQPTTVLYGSRGEILPRAETVELLPREPSLSEMQVLATVGPVSVLREDASQTLRGILESTRQLIEDVAGLLIPLWDVRRSDPTLIRQPEKQWKSLDRPEVTGFEGYCPGSVRVQPDTLMMAPEWLTRLKSAALIKGRDSVWGTPTDVKDAP